MNKLTKTSRVSIQSFDLGPEFRGIKMIPSGLHFVNWSSVSKEGSMGPKTGFFHNFGQKEVLVRKFDQKLEDVIDTLPDDEVNSCLIYKIQVTFNCFL